MLCWGNASFGQLGLGGIDEEIVLEPRKSDFFINKKVRDVGCGLRHTVFVLDDGTVYTCGCNDLGQLGHEKSRKKPVAIQIKFKIICRIMRILRNWAIFHVLFTFVPSYIGRKSKMSNGASCSHRDLIF
ncbi:hypothetical protein FD754_017684 [Muntiacus muntjak]|uniref:HECT domain-containing protein n=1 Tax=Muntiacus muntjak TaxID=9888 RepID=A0A5N3VUM4_MUNMU|nr:hypothetical protein FD754_017684 [Muntiacus muntjak]